MLISAKFENPAAKAKIKNTIAIILFRMMNAMRNAEGEKKYEQRYTAKMYSLENNAVLTFK